MFPNARSKVRDSSTSVSRTSSNPARVALRKGDLKISDPIPIPRAGDGYGPQSLPVNTGPRQRQSNPIQSEEFDHIRAIPRVPSYATVPALATDSSKTSLAKPKESGFKATLRKLFGGKKKRDTVGSYIGEDQKKRDALSFITTADSAREPPPKQRGVSVPEITRHSALGSHAPLAAYILPEGSAPTEEKGGTAGDSFVDTHRRCNTLPSVILTEKEEEALKASIDDSAIRPTSRSKSVKNDSKRRSRSMENLMNRLKPIEWPRNRSDEIKYWRNSVLESPIPSYKPQTMDKTDEAPVEEDQQSDKKSSPIEPVQAFDFGLDNPTGQTNDSTEQRLNTLEIKLVDLEFAIAKLQQGSEGEKTMTLERPPLSRSERSQASARTTSSASGIASPEPTFLSSPRPSSAFSQDSDDRSSPPLEHRIHRTSAATTLRPGTAVRRSVEQQEPPPAPPPHSPYATRDQFQNLLAMIQREQASRHRLELQVKNLSSQLEQYQRSPPYAQFKGDLSPTPSPDDAARFVRQPVRSGPISSERRANPPPPIPPSRFRDDVSVSTTDDDEDGYRDVYETPTEDREQKFSFENLRSPQMVGMI